MPIITSLLDTDFYKFTMGNVVFQLYPNVRVKYAFKNRTKSVKIADVVDEKELRWELDHVRTLKFNNSELHYLRGTNEYGERMFPEDYLQFLKNLQLPEYYLEKSNGTYILEFSGKWSEAIYWETIALSIVNELYYRALMRNLSSFDRDVAYADGRMRLAAKIKTLRQNPSITFADFGTRRRFSRDWQYYVVETLTNELPEQFIGSSNTRAAMDYGLLPIGTSAHEMYMVLAGLAHSTDEGVRASHNQTLKDWWEVYGWGLSIALTDTFGTNFFFQDMTQEQASAWKGLRQDSGDPIKFGESAIEFYKGHKVDPREKLLVFSDGLDLDMIQKIHDHFLGRIKTTFGWGTNLTNDLGFEALSLVIKAVEVDGNGTVKLSDNMAKAMGANEDIERYKRIFGHTITEAEECKY